MHEALKREEEYWASRSMNQSTLKIGLVSAKHMNFAMENLRPATSPMDFGTAYHHRILQPEIYSDVVAVFEGRRDKRTKVYQEFLAEHDSKIILNKTESDIIEAMAEALYKNKIATGLLLSADKLEQPVYWTDSTTGMKCKALVDIISTEHLFGADLKTCKDISRTGLKKAFWNYRYDIQDAFYLRGLRKHLKHIEPAFYFVCQEKTPPFDVAIVELDDFDRGEANEAVNQLLGLYKACRETGHWPGLGEEIEVLNMRNRGAL